MKWTRFRQEFEDGGPLYKLMNDGKLKQDPDTPIIKGRPGILVCEKPNSIVDNCFRIYDTDPASFESNSIYGRGDSYKNFEHYHKWFDFGSLGNEYFDEAYFDVGFFEENYIEKRFIKRDNKYFNSKYNKDYRKGIYGGKEYPRPHPFEMHCGGWAHFFDAEVRRGDTDHAIYFKWNRKSSSVTVYINQTKPDISWNVNVNVNITNPPGSQDPPPPPLHPPWY